MTQKRPRELECEREGPVKKQKTTPQFLVSDDLLFYVFAYLPGRDLNKARLVSKQWYATQKSNYFIQTICKQRGLLHDTELEILSKKIYHKYYMYLGVKQAKAYSYYREDNVLISEYTMKDDKKHGEHRTFTKSGELRQLVTYQNNRRTGPVQIYNDKKILVKDAMYRNDKLHGPCKNWSKHGALLFSGSYDNGKLDGLIEAYESNDGGKTSYLETRAHYQKGKLHGHWELFHSQGWKVEERNYNVGVLHGEVIKYYKNGDVWTREFYEQGKIVSLKHL